MQPIQGVFLFLTAVVLLQAVPGHGTMIEDPRVERDVLHKYPGLFHTKQEIDEHMANLLRSSPTRRVIPWIVVLGAVTYNACCKSNSTTTYFDELPDHTGKKYKLVHFQQKKQWIQTDTACGNVPDCSWCKCLMEDRYFSALCFNPDYPNNSNNKYVLQLVKAPLVCKCFNQSSDKPYNSMCGLGSALQAFWSMIY